VKELIDIQVVLATPEDMDVFDPEDAESAADALNQILHMLYDRVDDDIATETLENMIQHCWETWLEDQQLIVLDEIDLSDWVDQLIATWDDAQSQ
jgi:hypothetical protein